MSCLCTARESCRSCSPNLFPFPLRVLIESPFAGDYVRNRDYLHACIAHSLALGEAPFASHGFFPQVLDDTVPGQRAQGMRAGFAWGACAEVVAVYLDHGISNGMREGLGLWHSRALPIEHRRLHCVCGARLPLHELRDGCALSCRPASRERFARDARLLRAVLATERP